MNCPKCKAPILADDVNVAQLIAKCRHCQEVFRFGPDQVEAAAPAPRPTLMAPRPANIHVEEDAGERRLTWRWFNATYLFLLFFCVAWDGFLCFWYSIATGVAGFGDVGTGIFGLIMFIFPIAHVAIGIALTYTTAAGFLNTTTVTVGDRLTIRHGPLPWPGNLDVPVAEVKQLYCTLSPTRGRRYSYYDGPPSGDWLLVDLNVLFADGGQRKVIGYISRAEGIYLEQQIEQWLGLPQQHVPGEVR